MARASLLLPPLLIVRAKKLTNDYDGTTHDFTRKGGVVHTEILLSDNAPREYADRSMLWNAVEAVEKSKNAQLSREIEIVLPNELSEAKYVALAKEFARNNFRRNADNKR